MKVFYKKYYNSILKNTIIFSNKLKNIKQYDNSLEEKLAQLFIYLIFHRMRTIKQEKKLRKSIMHWIFIWASVTLYLVFKYNFFIHTFLLYTVLFFIFECYCYSKATMGNITK
jgi:hypothetical protein